MCSNSSHVAGSKPPQKVLFIDHLTRLLLDTLPDLWRLGQAYFSGKLLKEVTTADSTTNYLIYTILTGQFFFH